LGETDLLDIVTDESKGVGKDSAGWMQQKSAVAGRLTAQWREWKFKSHWLPVSS
jgi:hypothetical protein